MASAAPQDALAAIGVLGLASASRGSQRPHFQTPSETPREPARASFAERGCFQVLDLTNEEQLYLRELVAKAHAELLHELHHSSTGEFKDRLRREIALNERLAQRIAVATPELVTAG